MNYKNINNSYNFGFRIVVVRTKTPIKFPFQMSKQNTAMQNTTKKKVRKNMKNERKISLLM